MSQELDTLKTTIALVEESILNAIANAKAAECDEQLSATFLEREELIKEVAEVKDIEGTRSLVLNHLDNNLRNFLNNTPYRSEILHELQQEKNEEVKARSVSNWRHLLRHM